MMIQNHMSIPTEREVYQKTHPKSGHPEPMPKLFYGLNKTLDPQATNRNELINESLSWSHLIH